VWFVWFAVVIGTVTAWSEEMAVVVENKFICISFHSVRAFLSDGYLAKCMFFSFSA
jgi:hypothetical protein